jgi:5-methylthioadenosine/S-adenosylhomocysteine deaminase
MTNLLILPDWLIADTHAAPLPGWGVRVTGSEIADVAPNDVLRTRFPEANVWNAPGQALAPGFVNTHTHLYGVLAHGLPLSKAPSGFWPFLEDFWWPLVEDRLDHAMICAATDLRCTDMLQSGVTTFYDCTEAPHALPGVLSAQAEVVRRRGLRGILSFEATERVSAENGQLGLRENAEFVDACRRESAGCLVSGLICFHTTFTCSEPFIRQAFALAADRSVLTHMHMSEGDYEPDYAQRTFGMRPLAYYDRLGVAGPEMLASQCVQVDAAEIALMAERGVRASHMPLSNCEVGGGIAPVPDLLAQGVTLGLGSDGYVDDFFEVMRGAFLIHKANRKDPRVMPAQTVWHLATEGGARALKLDKVGRLAPGWQADLQLISLDSLPTPLAEHNLYDQLLLYRNHHHVTATLVAGQPRVQGGQVLGVDRAALIARTREAAVRLWKAL